MWPKFIQKPITDDSKSAGYTLIIDDARLKKQAPSRDHRVLKTVHAVALCILLLVILLSLARLSYSYVKSRWSHDRVPATKADRYSLMFQEFISSYNKSYASEVEKDFRFSIFVENVDYFESEERKHPGLDLDVTRFSDWTEEEMILFLSRNREVLMDASHSEGMPPSEVIKRPAEVDWNKAGKLTPVKDQGECGSCWAFATVAAIEAIHAINTGNLTRLSEQEMIDCDSQNDGCRGGYRPFAMKHGELIAPRGMHQHYMRRDRLAAYAVYRLRSFVQQNGLVKEEEYPYIAVKQDACLLKKDTSRVFIEGYRNLAPDEEMIANWIATKGPATFGMNVTKSLFSYRGGVFSPSKEDCEEHTLGSHALVFAGYGNENGQPYWLVKNSWGSRWGQGGYLKLARGQNSCGAVNAVVAPIMEN